MARFLSLSMGGMVALRAGFAHPSLDQPKHGRRTIAEAESIVRKNYAQTQEMPIRSKKIAACAESTAFAKQNGLHPR
jgi:hypothetical protein